MRKVSINHLKPGMVTGKPVLGFLGQVLLNSGITINARHIYYLKQVGIDAIYVYDERMGEVELDDLISQEVRSECRALVAGVMKNLDAASAKNKGLAFKEKDILETVSRVIDELLDNIDTLIQLSDIRAHDGYVFAHSVNCCVLSTLIAVKMGYDRNTLKLLATGALLHDIGLVAIPQMILKKPGSLTEIEYEAVKKHPQYGYEILRKSKLFSERLGEIILQHHERYGGSGYPHGLKGKEIASLARIAMVADVYDALTSDKVYRRAYPIHEAIEMMMAWGGEMFDMEALSVLLENLTAYPVGSHVLLSTGESGLVIKNVPGYSLRPLIRLLYKKDFSPHPSPYDLDLSRVVDITITGLVDEDALPST